MGKNTIRIDGKRTGSVIVSGSGNAIAMSGTGTAIAVSTGAGSVARSAATPVKGETFCVSLDLRHMTKAQIKRWLVILEEHVDTGIADAFSRVDDRARSVAWSVTPDDKPEGG